MLKTALVVLLAVVAALLGAAALRPDTFEVRRSIVVQSPPQRVFALVDDLEAFNRWNPWLAKEPGTKLSYGPTKAGPGARYAWEGDKTGAGSMTLTASSAPSRVAFDVDFVKPWEGHNKVEFTLQPDGGGTAVTWAMRGPMNLVSKVMDLVVGMDAMVGPDFETGLARLKALAEAR